MTETEVGETRSNVQAEQSAPNGTSTPSGEKKVSQLNDSSVQRRKRFILDCEERPDGSLSSCNLIPINEVKQPEPAVKRQQDSASTSTDPHPEKASEDRCTSRKCKVPPTMRKKMIQKNAVPIEGGKDKQ